MCELDDTSVRCVSLTVLDDTNEYEAERIKTIHNLVPRTPSPQ